MTKRGIVAVSGRLAAQTVRTNVEKDGKDALTVVVSELGPRMASRNGGYTKAFKLGPRRGDCAEVVLVRWSDL